MACWSRDEEVVHTTTFTGNPLACVAAISTLDVLSRHHLPTRARAVGEEFLAELEAAVAPYADLVQVRGVGLMIGIEFRGGNGCGSRMMIELLKRGYIGSTGGGSRETLVLTPALTIDTQQWSGFVEQLVEVLAQW